MELEDALGSLRRSYHDLQKSRDEKQSYLQAIGELFDHAGHPGNLVSLIKEEQERLEAFGAFIREIGVKFKLTDIPREDIPQHITEMLRRSS